MAGIEELAKALPVLYLMFRTRVGMAASPLDGLLYGAAAGAGFGFGEDAIYMVENASIYYVRSETSVASILLAWLPGGWANGYTWFPGHMVLTAVVGAGVGLGRRLSASWKVRIALAAVALGWTTFIHANVNIPADPSVSSLSNFLFYQFNGGGRYLPFMLAVLIFVLLGIDELHIRKISRADGMHGPSIFSDAALIVEGFGKGWRHVVRLRARQRCEEELIQLHWEIEHLRPPHAQVASDEIVATEKRLREAEPPLRQTSAAQSFWSFKGLDSWGVIYRVAAMLVMAYGFWLVFLSPSVEHRTAVAFSQTAVVTMVSIVGQMLMFWRFGSFLLREKDPADPSGASALTVLRCQSILIWSGCLTCLVALKDFYDAGTLPYPLRADVSAKYAQLRACYGGSTVPKTTPGFESPVFALASDPNGKFGMGTQVAAPAVAGAEASTTVSAPAAVGGVGLAAGGAAAVGAAVGVLGPVVVGYAIEHSEEVANRPDHDEASLPGGLPSTFPNDAGSPVPVAPTIPAPDPTAPTWPAPPGNPAPDYAPGEPVPYPGDPANPAIPGPPRLPTFDRSAGPGSTTPPQAPDSQHGAPTKPAPDDPHVAPDPKYPRPPSPLPEEPQKPPDFGQPKGPYR